MKTTFPWIGVSLLILPFVVLSCTDSDEIAVPDNVQPVNTHYVTYEDALQKAIAFLSDDQPQTRSGSFKVKEHHEYTANRGFSALTRSYDYLTDSIDVRFHVINFENNAGFALVSADDRTTPIYAYSTKGNMNLEEGIENSGLSDFMNGAIEHYIYEVGTASVNGPFPFIPDPLDNDSMLLYPITYFNGQYCYTQYSENTQTVPALLTTEWNQCSPYNYFCPYIGNPNPGYEERAATGCVTIAMAQIMAYHRFPLFWNWDSILTSPSYNPGIHNNTTDSVALYILDIAIAADVEWGINTFSNINKARNAFYNLGYYTSSPQSFDRNNIINSLILQLPVYCQGSEHAWVIDGYSHTTTTATYYELAPPHIQVGQETTSGYTYYHCNWGWGENGNNGNYLNTFVHPTNGSFNNNNKILYGILPIAI